MPGASLPGWLRFDLDEARQEHGVDLGPLSGLHGGILLPDLAERLKPKAARADAAPFRK
jgi:hypothetical protein